MTSVVAAFNYQGTLGITQTQNLGESYTQLGVRRISVDEAARTVSVEYDATRMDQRGVAALLRRLGVPIDGSLIT
ncbi:MAG: hypothetical protein EXQ56_09935 [Acidobacteria bacterium]|nr:hypothetical protein [Acidobacteriota bacterium]